MPTIWLLADGAPGPAQAGIRTPGTQATEGVEPTIDAEATYDPGQPD
jgi:hypothetical protein